MSIDRKVGSHRRDGGEVQLRSVGSPGKRTLTEQLPVQRKEVAAAPDREPAPARAATQVPAAQADPVGMQLWVTPVQRRQAAGTFQTNEVHEAAARGVNAPTTAMPYAAAIEASFGPVHDVSQITAHVGGAAAVQRNDDIHHQAISETTDTGNRYQQELDINKTTNHVQIQFGINWIKQGTWSSNEAFGTFVSSIKTTVYSYLDRKFKIVATPKAGGSAIELSIDFLLSDIGDGYKIECFGDTHGRSAMAQASGKLYEKGPSGEGAALPAVTAAHEFGHCLLGVSDEYANPAVPNRTISNDHSIMGNYKTQGAAQAEFKVRHFENILKNVAAQYPGHTCRLATT